MRFGQCNYVTLHRGAVLFALVLLGVAMGIWQEILIPTLPNLKQKLNVSYEVLSQAMSMRSLGNIASLLLAGYIFDSFPFYMNYVIFLACFIAGVSTILIPWCSQLWLVIPLIFLQSGAQYLINNGGQLTVLKTFREKAVSRMQIYHLGYGIGGLLSGVIAGPFLSQKRTYKGKITEYCKTQLQNRTFSLMQSVTTTPSATIHNVTIHETETKSQFEYVFLIAGSVAIVISFIYLCITSLRNPEQIEVKSKKRESWLKKLHPNYTAKGKVLYGTSMTILLGLHYFTYMFGLINYLPLIVVYAIDPCKEYFITQKEAAHFHSVVNGFFLLGRVVGTFTMTWNPTVMIICFNCLNLISVAILILFSNKYLIALWIGSCGMRFCNSVFYPFGTSYVNRYIIVTSTLISIAFLGATFGVMGGGVSGGYIVDHYPSYYILFPCFGFMTLLFIVTLAIIILGHKNGRRDFNEVPTTITKSSDVRLSKT